LHAFFENSNVSPIQSKDVEKLVPKGLSFSTFSFFFSPPTREGDCALTNFVPGETLCRLLIQEIYCALSGANWNSLEVYGIVPVRLELETDDRMKIFYWSCFYVDHRP